MAHSPIAIFQFTRPAHGPRTVSCLATAVVGAEIVEFAGWTLSVMSPKRRRMR